MFRKLHEDKVERSSPEFKDARVTSCSSVFMRNGQAVAMAFKTAKKLDFGTNNAKSSERQSFSSAVYKQRPNLHAGMYKKPLEPYHPNAYRSRLPSPTIIMPYKNSSSICIGDRSSFNTHQFKTTNQNEYDAPKKAITSNTGILAEVKKYKKAIQAL